MPGHLTEIEKAKELFQSWRKGAYYDVLQEIYTLIIDVLKKLTKSGTNLILLDEQEDHAVRNYQPKKKMFF